jgi:thiol-disulfide isomerase/thioredoxin
MLSRFKYPIAIGIAGVFYVLFLVWHLTPAKQSISSEDGRVAKSPAEIGFTGAKMVELYTPYCAACKEMAPFVKALSGSCRHHGVSVETLDISLEENEHVIDELGVTAVPTFIFIDDVGVETTRLVGRQSIDRLIEHLAEIGGAKCNTSS